MQQPGPNNIFLCGFMGVGKSTVAPLVAGALGWTFLDTDAWIEKQSGKKIAVLFSAEGESRFREWETQAITGIGRGKNQVVALGGGALNLKRNRDLILKNGLLVYLKAGIETILARVEPNERPLLKSLTGDALTKHISDLIKAREPQYATAAITVDTNGKMPADIANEIIEEVSRWKP